MCHTLAGLPLSRRILRSFYESAPDETRWTVLIEALREIDKREGGDRPGAGGTGTAGKGKLGRRQA